MSKQQMTIKKQENSQLNNLLLHLKYYKEVNKAQSQQNEGNKDQSEITETERKKTLENINGTKNWFFGKINKIDKLSQTLPRKKREGHKQEIKEGTLQQTPQNTGS